jgi:hypothetical protein
VAAPSSHNVRPRLGERARWCGTATLATIAASPRAAIWQRITKKATKASHATGMRMSSIGSFQFTMRRFESSIGRDRPPLELPVQELSKRRGKLLSPIPIAAAGGSAQRSPRWTGAARIAAAA